jgi:D-3-phosphoglycerate dehydrogenase / 2-oxoglutarate reductase
MNTKILITDTIHECIIPMLIKGGFEVDYLPGLGREEILNALKQYIGVIIRSKTPADRAFMDAGAPNLKFIARSGAGMDQVDLEYASKTGITLLNAPEGNRDAVAEHTVGMLLLLINKLRVADAQVRAGIWDREGNRGTELMGKTFAIIGYGFMGTAVSKRLTGFGCNVIAYDKYKIGYGSELVKETTLEEVYDQADIVSFHIPLTAETKFYVNDSFIGKFRKNIIILNTARGEIIPLESLVKNLKSGKIIATGLDVLENERMDALSPHQKNLMNEISAMDQVILTPHVAGWTVESYIKISETLGRKILGLKLALS